MKQIIKLTIITCAVTLALSGCSESTNSSSYTAPLTSSKAHVKELSTYSAETFFDTTSIMGSSFSPHGDKILVSSDESGIYSLYEVNVQTGGKTRLTDFTDSTYPIRYFPNDERVLFTKDTGGNERFHIYVRETDGTVKDLTPGDETRASFAGFTKNASQFFITSNQRDAKFMDLYRVNSKTYKVTPVYQNTLGLNVGAISPNGRFIALSKSNSNKDSDTFILDTYTKTLKPQLISKHHTPAQYSPETFSADNKYLYYSTDAKGEFSQMWRYDLASGEHSPALADDWDVSFIYFSTSGRYQVSGVNADASTKVTVIDTQTNKEIAMPKLPAGNLRGVSFSADEQSMAFYLNSDTAPSNLFVWQVGSNNTQQLTNTLSKKINQNDLVQSTIVRFKSFDGLEIPGVLYKPKQASSTNKVPALIWVHGGPGGQSRTGYSAMQQHLVNHGYAIFAVNNRGSSGYGKTFFHLDDKKHGTDDLQDIVYGKKHLQSLEWVDTDKIGIMGGSYGGFMTAAALAFEPEEFKVGINIFGVTNWVRTLNSIPPWWESFKKSLYDEMGDPATDGDRHRAISPLFHARNIIKPLMVIQGANDPRVLQVESDELVAAVKANGVPVEYVLFDDEGHGFSKKENRITASNAYLKFLEQYLKAE
ncbi:MULTISPECIES: S9 family peptidase [Pseudoalteromonas]|uniref:S9 family peptidase n=1 Tax=Pseudoalteromonas TaxID=53246 RepID=UPI0015F915AF|nr:MULTISPECIES: S9 family peptidase [Pseudoalteromonas]MBB1371804.1 S9 family peptidase [Pseudoalteromonas sp. SR45-4]MBH0093203.1 S9 family peptidase [Pseudoalteromonas sp. SCQQ13]MBO7926172.1 S9 family peptidase [Pseudoalteromonas sp. K222D]